MNLCGHSARAHWRRASSPGASAGNASARAVPNKCWHGEAGTCSRRALILRSTRTPSNSPKCRHGDAGKKLAACCWQ
eukprot:14091329-Alexandrium_andersonii.AAC.1